jgi:Ca-activated chloride channel family protein
MLDLDDGDFEVLDDGRPQRLTVFRKGLQPITAAVLVDTSASMTLNLDLARGAAEQFVIRMFPGDTARVGSFSDRVDLSPRFTGDRDALLRSLGDDLHIGNPTVLWDAVDETMTALGPLGGRRVLLVLTDGIDTASRALPTTILERARADDLMIYVVQFRTTARAQLAEEPLAPTASQLFSDNGSRRRQSPGEFLRRLALQSGGGHFVLGQYDDINATFTQVMHELHHQYVLGFVPERSDGRLHDLRVRVNRPGLTIRARQSYRAPGGSDPP